MRIESEAAEFDALIDLAKDICVACRTAPKACGIDNTDTLILTDEEKSELTREMCAMGEEFGEQGGLFIRDADNVNNAQVIVLIGINYNVRGLSERCQLCGFSSCADCEAVGASCIFAGIDLGIALGSATALAAQAHADNRILFTAGKAAARLGLLGDHTLIMGLPLYSGGKNIFFDRR